MTAPAAIFICSICGEPSSEICVSCTKDACGNHRCDRCKRCSDCCECDVPLSAAEAEVAAPVEAPAAPVAEAQLVEATLAEASPAEAEAAVPVKAPAAPVAESQLVEAPLAEAEPQSEVALPEPIDETPIQPPRENPIF